MSEAALSSADSPPQEAGAPRFSVRAAAGADLELIHRQLLAVIDESPYYNAEFKGYEKARLTRDSRAIWSQATWATIPYRPGCR